MKDNRVGPALVKVSSSLSYTLAELRDLAREFLNDMENRGHVTVFGAESLTDWKFETFLQWLGRKERETNERGT